VFDVEMATGKKTKVFDVEMATGKKTKVFDAKITENQTVISSKIVNVFGFTSFLAWIKNIDAEDDLMWRVQSRMTGDDPDAAWETLMSWTRVGEGVTDYFPADINEEVLVRLAWDEVRLQIAKWPKEAGEAQADAWINRKRG